MDQIRRVIAGIDADGRSIFVSDEVVVAKRSPLKKGPMLLIFGDDNIPTVPNSGRLESRLGYFPAHPGGYRMMIFTHEPGDGVTIPEDPETLETLRRDAENQGLSRGHTGTMHATATVDLEYVIQGEMTLTLDSGESRVLRAGDSIIQCGVRHRWQNTGDGPASVLVCFIGAHADEARFSAL